MCCRHEATKTPVQKPTNENGVHDWLQHLTYEYDHAPIDLEAISPYSCRCLDWSTCRKHVSGYLRHSMLRFFCSEFLHAFSLQRYTKEQTRLAVVIADSNRSGVSLQFWWHPPDSLLPALLWQRQAEVQRAVASEAQWIRIMGQLTVWLFSKLFSFPH